MNSQSIGTMLNGIYLIQVEKGRLLMNSILEQENLTKPSEPIEKLIAELAIELTRLNDAVIKFNKMFEKLVLNLK